MTVKNIYPVYTSEQARKLALQQTYRNIQRTIYNRNDKRINK